MVRSGEGDDKIARLLAESKYKYYHIRMENNKSSTVTKNTMNNLKYISI